MSNPFEYVDALSFSKKDMMRGTENDELSEKSYVPFLVNRSLSYHIDAVLEANQMNLCAHLDSKLQFDFLLNTLRKRKRFAKWCKPVSNNDLEAVMEYFKYNRSTAEQALKCLTAEDMSTIYSKIDKGGIKHDRAINK